MATATMGTSHGERGRSMFMLTGPPSELPAFPVVHGSPTRSPARPSSAVGLSPQVSNGSPPPAARRSSQTRPASSQRRNTSSKPANHSEPPPMGRLTLWDYLKLEVRGGAPDAHGLGDEKVENLLNVVSIPWYLEKVVTFGMLTCFDAFLHAFTILPLRMVYALYRKAYRRPITQLEKSDLIKGPVLLALFLSLINLDTSRIYHSIRGQAAIKLYVMFNVLEIADKLCAALGQDILECLFTPGTLARKQKTAIFTVLLFIYSYVHSYVLLYQIITLNVAINSYSNALLTLLLSNQFSEIKGTVFKKFERENLFQLTCADITERFQLLIMLLVIGVRNVVEVSAIGIIPASWAGWNRWFGALFGPACVVVGSEIAVDWLKHAYITKFNNIRPRVYRKFLDVLAVDYAENAFSDQTMTKRIGLPVFPLVAVAAKMIVQSYYMVIEQTAPTSTYSNVSFTVGTSETATSAAVLEKIDSFFYKGMGGLRISPSTLYFSANILIACIIVFLITLILKLVLGLLLLNYATKKHAHATARHRPKKSIPIPSSNAEKKHVPPPLNIAATQSGVSVPSESDFAPDRSSGFGVVKLDEKARHELYEADEDVPEPKSSKQPDTSVNDLLNVTRFKMVAKRIW